MSNFGETFSPIAAKDHRCEWCYGPIPKGEKHKHFTGMWDNEWQNWRMHDECYAESLNDLDDGFTPGCAGMRRDARKNKGISWGERGGEERKRMIQGQIIKKYPILYNFFILAADPSGQQEDERG